MKTNVLLLISASMVLLLAFSLGTQPTENWPVPDKYKNMKNPVSADKAALSTGKTLYNQHCKSCHGKEGLGDGSQAGQLDTPCGDFSSEEFQSQSDGSIFYKTMEGKGDMPGFKKKISDAEDVWSMVHYMRTMEE